MESQNLTTKKYTSFALIIICVSLLQNVYPQVICNPTIVENVQISSANPKVTFSGYSSPSGFDATWSNPTVSETATLTISGWKYKDNKVLRISITSNNISNVVKDSTDPAIVITSKLDLANIYYLGFKDQTQSIKFVVTAGATTSFTFKVVVHEKGWIDNFGCNLYCQKVVYQFTVGEATAAGQYNCWNQKLGLFLVLALACLILTF